VTVLLLALGGWAFLVLLVLTICRGAARADEQDERAARRLVAASRRSRTIGLVTAATALSAHASAPYARAVGCASPARGSPAPQVAAAVRCRISELRRRHGLGGLDRAPRLAVAARRYAADMAEHDFFSHVSPAGSRLPDRVARTGYANGGCTWHVGEVLAWGTGGRATARSTVRAWMKSPPHRRVLLGADFDDVGVGVAPGDPVGSGTQPAITVVALLGHRHC
jgi:uncharacterized protein YkwD